MMSEYNLSKRELEERLRSAYDRILIKDARIENIKNENEDLRQATRQQDKMIKQQNHAIMKHLQKRKKLMHDIKALKARLKFYENSNTPPSHGTLKDKEMKKERKEEKENAAEKDVAKIGGREGYTGASRPHNPEKTVIGRFENPPVCRCGHEMKITGHGTCDIIEIPEIRVHEIRYKIERACCSKCGETRHAPQ